MENLQKPTFPTYEYTFHENGQRGILCRVCGLTSYSKDDVSHRYCGNCHKFHKEMMLERLIEKTKETSALLQKEIEKMEKSIKRTELIIAIMRYAFLVWFLAGWVGWVIYSFNPNLWGLKVLVGSAIGGMFAQYVIKEFPERWRNERRIKEMWELVHKAHEQNHG